MKTKNLTAQYALIQSVFWISGCCTLTYTTPFLQARGFTNTEIGVTLAFASCLTILLQPFVAAFADRSKKLTLNRLIPLLLVLTAILSVVLVLMPAVFLPTAVLCVLLSTLTRMQNSLLTSLSSEQVQAGGKLNFSLARGVGSFSFAVASMIIGYLIDSVSTDIVFPICAVGAVLAIAVIFAFPKPAARAAREKAAEEPASLPEFIRENGRFVGFAVCLVLIYLSHIFINSFTIQVVMSRGGSGSEMGLASAIGGFLELPAMALFPYILKKVGSVSTILKMSAVAMTVKSLITFMAPNLGWFYFAQALQFFAYAMLIPACVYYVNRMIASKDKVKGQSLVDMAQVLAAVIGSVLGGVFLDLRGVDFMLIIGTAVSGVGALLLFFIIQKDKAPETEA
ncbi:MAG: MFS transporter [Clostridia bacterium]|nr:MFS transporter [Clostridia bacterium]